MNEKNDGESRLERLRKMELNVTLVVGFGMLLLAVLLYIFAVRPKQAGEKMLREWNSPQAAAARSPEGRKVDPRYAEAVQAALAREGKERRATARH